VCGVASLRARGTILVAPRRCGEHGTVSAPVSVRARACTRVGRANWLCWEGVARARSFIMIMKTGRGGGRGGGRRARVGLRGSARFRT
jgi:hypothetical protein